MGWLRDLWRPRDVATVDALGTFLINDLTQVVVEYGRASLFIQHGIDRPRMTWLSDDDAGDDIPELTLPPVTSNALESSAFADLGLLSRHGTPIVYWHGYINMFGTSIAPPIRCGEWPGRVSIEEPAIEEPASAQVHVVVPCAASVLTRGAAILVVMRSWVCKVYDLEKQGAIQKLTSRDPTVHRVQTERRAFDIFERVLFRLSFTTHMGGHVARHRHWGARSHPRGEHLMEDDRMAGVVLARPDTPRRQERIP